MILALLLGCRMWEHSPSWPPFFDFPLNFQLCCFLACPSPFYTLPLHVQFIHVMWQGLNCICGVFFFNVYRSTRQRQGSSTMPVCTQEGKPDQVWVYCSRHLRSLMLLLLFSCRGAKHRSAPILLNSRCLNCLMSYTPESKQCSFHPGFVGELYNGISTHSHSLDSMLSTVYD